MLGTGTAEEFIDDAEHHNQWWSDGTFPRTIAGHRSHPSL